MGKAGTRQPDEQSCQNLDKTDGEAAVLARIALMPEPDRSICERLHAIVKASAPGLSPKLWYTMPAYAKDGKVICFFRESHMSRPATGRAPSLGLMGYVTFGFNETTNLDEGAVWPIAFAVKELTAAAERRIAALVRKAVS
jgi:uncharacterized protein YdhG (YjbR/CyaY superfamily)